MAGVTSIAIGPRIARRWLVKGGYGMVAVALVVPALVLRWSNPPLRSEPAAGVVVWRAEHATIVELASGVPADRLLASLRQAGVRRVDLVVLRADGAVAAAQTAALRHRWSVGRVLEPSGGTVPERRCLRPARDLGVGPFTVSVVVAQPRLMVHVRGPSARSAGEREPGRVASCSSSSVPAASTSRFDRWSSAS